MTTTQGNKTERRKARRGLGFLGAVAAAPLALGLALAAAQAPTDLPLPPPPAVDVALMRTPVAGRAAEVLFADETTVNEAAIPAVPLDACVPLVPRQAGVVTMPETSVPVEEVLAVIRQDAPKNATLESMMFEQLRGAMPQGSEGYIFERATLPNMTNLPAQGWRVRYDFHLPTRGIGSAPFTAAILGEGDKVLRTFTGSVMIDREATGVQVTRVMHRGEPLGPRDYQVMGTRLSHLPRGALDRADALQGTVSRQELRPGQWLTDQMVQVPQIIKQSQPVTMIVRRGPIRIVAPGVSRQAGALGEVIRVENVQSQRVLYARVISKDEVQVVF